MRPKLGASWPPGSFANPLMQGQCLAGLGHLPSQVCPSSWHSTLLAYVPREHQSLQPPKRPAAPGEGCRPAAGRFASRERGASPAPGSTARADAAQIGFPMVIAPGSEPRH